MYSTSLDYKTEIRKGNRSFKARITTGDKVLTDDDIVSMDITINQGSETYIGNTISKVLDLVFLNKDFTFVTNDIVVEIGIDINGTIEYIPVGTFKTDDVKTEKLTTTVTAYDSMYKTEVAYFSNYNGKSTAITNLMAEICSKCGLTFSGTLPTYNITYNNDHTCREMIGYIASLVGGNAFITNDNKLIIKALNGGDSTTATADNYFNMQLDEETYKIGKITCTKGDNTSISKGSIGADSVELQFANPYMTDSIMTDIYDKLKDFNFLGYTCNWQGDLSIEPFDFINITDVNNVVRKCIVLSQKLSYNGGLTSEISAKGKSKNDNSYNPSMSATEKVNRMVTDLLLVKEEMADKITVNDLTANNIKFETASGKTLLLQELLAQFVSGENGQFLNLTGGNVVIDEEVVKDLIAAKISVGDLIAGNIDSERFNIVSKNGNLIIKDNTIQIKDSNRVRIQIGKDASGDYTLNVWDKEGKLLFNSNGITANAIKSKIIRDDMVADNADINATKLNKNSLFDVINEDGSKSIKASKVMFDSTGQTAELSFKELKENTDNSIETVQNITKTTKDSVDNLIKKTTITKDGKEVKLEDSYSDLYKDAYGIKSTVSSMQTDVSDAKEKATNAQSSVEQLANTVKTKVSQSDVDKSINNIQIGGRNLIRNADANAKNATAWGNTTLVTHNFYKNNTAKMFVIKTSSSSENTSRSERFDIKPNTKYTFSFIGFASSNVSSMDVHLLSRKKGETKDYTDVHTFIYRKLSSTHAEEVVVTFTTHQNIEEGYIRIDNNGSTDGKDCVLFFNEIQLEEGTKKSAFKLAAEDTQEQINNVVQRVSTAEQKITADAIVSAVTTSDTYKNDLKGKVDTKTYSSYTEQTAKDIKSKVSSSDFETYKEQTSKDISSKVAKDNFGSLIKQNSDSVKVAFGNVGNGENLVKNGNGTFKLNNWNKWSGFSSTATFTNYGIKWFYIVASSVDTGENMVYQDVEVSPNATYTFSCSTHIGDGVKSYDIFVTGGKSKGRWDYIRNPVLAGTTDKNVTYTFTTKSDETYVRIRFDNNGYKAGTSHSFSFTNVKLEVGDKKTPFCLATDEIDNASIKMDSTGVKINSGSLTCKKGDAFTILDHGKLGFANQTASGYEETAVISSTAEVGSGTYINGVSVKILGKGDYLTVGYTDNYNDTIETAAACNSIVEIRNPKWGKYTSESYHVIFAKNQYTFGSIGAQSLEISGTKHRIVETPYGTVGMNAVESCDALFEDVGDGQTDENGLCIIPLDAVFSETISLDIMYQVFLQKCGEGYLYISERHENYFVVKGTPNLAFCWNIKAKQKGYSKDRCIDVDSRNAIDKSISNVEESITDLEKNVDSIITDDILSDIDNLLKESEE